MDSLRSLNVLMPYLEVSKFLAQKGHQISLISTPKNISRLSKLPPHLSYSSNISFVELPFPQVHGLPPGVESTSDIPTNKVPYLKKAFDKLEIPLTEILKTSQVNWIIHDFAPYWLPGVATPLGINLVALSIFNATAHAFISPPSVLFKYPRRRSEDYTTVPEWIDYPCKIALKSHEMASHQECMDEDVSDFLRVGHVIQGSQFVSVRSCLEFEPDAIHLLHKKDETWQDVKKWLDSKEEKSVFFVAFGTEVSLSQELMHELTFGIEKSNLSFIWAVKNRPLVEGKMGQDIIPPGFEERVRDRGLVLRGWAPQLRILAHSSIGGFLTHCGWSSNIEVLGFGRALILFSGASSDQGLNARLMHDKKVGLEIERNEMDGSSSSDVVAQTIRQVTVEPEGEPLRANAWAMRDIFGNLELGKKYLDDFARFIKEFAPSTGNI
ncbi:hypothetical protein DITRI_Ditri03aG0050600 [Diplodiscus trichospermus]